MKTQKVTDCGFAAKVTNLDLHFEGKLVSGEVTLAGVWAKVLLRRFVTTLGN
jgi:hypothetical protein